MERFGAMETVPDPAASAKPSDRLEEAYVRNAPAGLRLAYFLTGDRDLAEDLLQDAFVRVGARMRHLAAVDDVDAYLRKTIVNLFRSSLRRKRVERSWLARHRDEPDAQPAEDPTERDAMWRRCGRSPIGNAPPSSCASTRTCPSATRRRSSGVRRGR